MWTAHGSPKGPLGAPWGPEGPPWDPLGPNVTSKVSYGPVVPGLGLVWPGPVMPALPWPGPATTTTAAAKPPPAAEGGRLLLLARQARQAQARPSQGWAQQASQPSQSRVGLLPPTNEDLVTFGRPEADFVKGSGGAKPPQEGPWVIPL